MMDAMKEDRVLSRVAEERSLSDQEKVMSPRIGSTNGSRMGHSGENDIV